MSASVLLSAEELKRRLEGQGFRSIDVRWISNQSPMTFDNVLDQAIHSDVKVMCPLGTLTSLLSPSDQGLADLALVENTTLSIFRESDGCILQLQDAQDISVPQYVPEIEKPVKESSKGTEESSLSSSSSSSSASYTTSTRTKESSLKTDYNRRRRTLRLHFTDGKRALSALE